MERAAAVVEVAVALTLLATSNRSKTFSILSCQMTYLMMHLTIVQLAMLRRLAKMAKRKRERRTGERKNGSKSNNFCSSNRWLRRVDARVNATTLGDHPKI